MTTENTPPITIDRQVTDAGEIVLQQRILADGSVAFEIISDGVFLMASYNQTSERALARHAIAAVKGPRETRSRDEIGDKFRILVGGLGMGLTLQECLNEAADLGYETNNVHVDVVEISQAIVEWNFTHLATVNGHILDHPNVRLIQADLHDLLIRSLASTYDIIVLDVDNGPSWLAHGSNERLYDHEALGLWARILKPGGVLAVWSAQPEPAFLQRLSFVFGNAKEIAIKTPHLRKGTTDDYVYLASVSAPVGPQKD